MCEMHSSTLQGFIQVFYVLSASFQKRHPAESHAQHQILSLIHLHHISVAMHWLENFKTTQMVCVARCYSAEGRQALTSQFDAICLFCTTSYSGISISTACTLTHSSSNC